MNTDEKKIGDEDQEILAEERKSKLWHLRLERYAEVAKTVSIILQAFKAEAVSLVSGIGTLILGWYHIKKWITRGQKEVAYVAPPARSESPQAKTKMFTTTIEIPGGQAQIEAPVLLDPMLYLFMSILGVFVWASVVIWLKKRKQPKS